MNQEILKMRLNHLGQIGFRLSLFGLIVGLIIFLGSFISMFIVAFVAIFGFILPLVTLGIPFVVNPNYFSDLGKLLENSTSVINFVWSLTTYIKFIAIAGIIGSVVGAVFLLWDKNDRHWGQFVFCLISCVCCLVLFILIISGTFSQTVI